MHKMLRSIAVAFAMLSTSAQSAQYADQQQRAIKSLADSEVADLLAGQGMGLAKAAELNGFPGPAHVLEHADALVLSAQQLLGTKSLLDRHKASARQIGAALVAAEEALDRAFSTRRVDNASLSRLTGDIGSLQARLREEHLRTHLEQTALLSSEQIQQYATLRGYITSGVPFNFKPSSHDGKHH